MKKRIWVIFVALLFLTPLVFATDQEGGPSDGGCGGSGGSEQWDLNSAIMELFDSDQYIRRNAGRRISKLTSVPGIQRAVNPLIKAIEDVSNREGNLNRSLFLTTLGLVVRELKPQTHHVEEAIEYMSEILMSDNSDIVRSGAAQALGSTKKEIALEPLEFASANDPSPLVTQVVNESLDLLKAELGIENQSMSPDTRGTLSTVSLDGFEENDLEEYLQRHVIILGDGN